LSLRKASQTSRGQPQATKSDAELHLQTILSVLKTYPSSDVAVVGCHAARISRESCEYDLLVVSRDPTPPKYVRAGDFYAEIFFRSEAELRNPDPELGASVAKARVLRDGSLLLAGMVANCERRFKEYCVKAAESHLASALKALGRVDGELAKNPPEADFWLVSAAADLALSEIYSSQQVPSPSHIFSQMKGLSKSKSGSFREWTEASGFKIASRESCENRLEALSVLYDIMRTTSMDMRMALKFGRYRSEDAMAIEEEGG